MSWSEIKSESTGEGKSQSMRRRQAGARVLARMVPQPTKALLSKGKGAHGHLPHRHKHWQTAGEQEGSQGREVRGEGEEEEEERSETRPSCRPVPQSLA